jgi:hypothetical protein
MINRNNDRDNTGYQIAVVAKQPEMQLVSLALKIDGAQRQPEWCTKNSIAQYACALILV